jgi:hypothetical protein
MRSRTRSAEKPVKTLTNYVGRGYMSQAAALGVTCLSKPVAIADLLSEINELLAFKIARRKSTGVFEETWPDSHLNCGQGI